MSRPALALAIPVGVTIFAVVIIFLFSRVLLNVSRDAATPLALLGALVVLGACTLAARSST